MTLDPTPPHGSRLASGARIGPYEVLDPLGSGGMGQVHRARDTRLNRTVAIKALHAIVAADPERVARFEREAQLLASLNHPNIAAIHGLEQVDGTAYLVLEFVDGRPLSDYLASAGRLPVSEAVALARQVAEALAASHERGIIHRDLKPGNLMVTPDGQVKVLDFGLGKMIEAEASGASDPHAAAHSPTMTLGATQAGMLLGTAAYMSPEQAKGRPADRRSDVWAFGCVLYELLTGRRAFDGEDITETLAAIVRGEPDWSLLPADVPPALRTLLQRCLARSRAERLPDMSVVRFLLLESSILAPAPAATAPNPPAADGRSLQARVAVGLVIAAILATAGVMRLFGPAAAPPAPAAVRLAVPLPDDVRIATTNLMPLAISPDGAVLVFAGQPAHGNVQLFVRPIGAEDSTPLPGTEEASMPFFSPDSRWIGFFAQGRLKKIAVTGSGLQVLAEDAPDGRGGSWGVDGHIYFTPTNTTGLFRVPASGGDAVELTRRDPARGEISHRWPHLLPDGDTLLFTIWTGPGQDERTIVAQSLSSGERRALVTGGDTPRYVAGHLLYTRTDRLFAVPWQPSQRDVAGAVPLEAAEQVRVENEGGGALAISETGVLVFLKGAAARYAHRLVWVDRAGQVTPVPAPERNYESVALSPDGRLAMVQVMDATASLWVYDFSRDTLTPFPTPGSSQAPTWTPDGRRVIYRGTRAGQRDLYMKSADGTGEEERLTDHRDSALTPTDISGDGAWVLFSGIGARARSEMGVWTLRLDGDRAPRPLTNTAAREGNGQLSPNGRWMAIQSALTGRMEIYVRPFPGGGASQLVSTDGGTEPLWSRDGRELFYVSGDQLLAVDVSAGATFSAGRPRVIARGRYRPSANTNTPYSVAADGRFLRVQQSASDHPPTRIEVVLHWSPVPRGQAAR
jgi:eukaryotic-like serine/threonine-protein kinase